MLKKSDHKTVVYVGRSKDKTLRRTLFNIYCKDGSEIEDLLTDALLSGYSVYARMKKSETATDFHDSYAVETDINSLLDKYAYAWNADRNAVRNILQ